MKKVTLTCLLVSLLSLSTITFADHHHHHHGGWSHGGIYFNIGASPAYYDDSYSQGPYYNCGWVPGHWYHGYWIRGHRACWYY